MGPTRCRISPYNTCCLSGWGRVPLLWAPPQCKEPLGIRAANLQGPICSRNRSRQEHQLQFESLVQQTPGCWTRSRWASEFTGAS